MRVLQAAEVLDFGDAVSNHMINIDMLLKELGYESSIYTRWVHEKCMEYYNDINSIKVQKDDILLYHFSGKSSILDKVKKLNCVKILVYHNVTPPEFFKNNNSDLYDHCESGIKQLKSSFHHFDLFVADSEFNKQDLVDMGIEASKIHVVPILLNFDEMDNSDYNKQLYDTYKTGSKNFLFVGRIAPNKKIEDVIEIFDYYYSKIDTNCNLLLVGNFECCPEYYQSLKDKVNSLACKQKIHFTGKVSTNDLYTYYKLADVFICMSEHEGFCVPIVESMHFKIPTIAFDACAIKYTMGGSGILVYEKKFDVIAEICSLIFEDSGIRNKIIEKQSNRLKEFEKENVKKQISLVIHKVTK